MEEQLYEELVNSIVKNLQESPYELKKFVINTLAYKETLQQIESWTRNPREYEPSYYSINHITKTVLEGDD